MFAGLFMYLIFLILGFAFGAFKRIPNKRKAIGVTESLEQRIGSHRGMISYTAVVAYVVGAKKYYAKTSYQSTSFKPGKKLIVYYDENNPQKSFVRSGIAIYLCMAACVITGTVLLFKDIIGLLM